MPVHLPGMEVKRRRILETAYRVYLFSPPKPMSLGRPTVRIPRADTERARGPCPRQGRSPEEVVTIPSAHTLEARPRPVVKLPPINGGTARPIVRLPPTGRTRSTSPENRLPTISTISSASELPQQPLTNGIGPHPIETDVRHVRGPNAIMQPWPTKAAAVPELVAMHQSPPVAPLPYPPVPFYYQDPAMQQALSQENALHGAKFMHPHVPEYYYHPTSYSPSTHSLPTPTTPYESNGMVYFYPPPTATRNNPNYEFTPNQMYYYQ